MTQIERQSITEALTCIGWLEETLTCWSWWWTNMSSFSEPTQICLQTFETSRYSIVEKAVHSVRRLLLRYFENIGNWIWCQVQADITGAAIDGQDRHHLLSCLPTGMGTTLPMLLTACLLPPGDIHSLLMHTWGRIFEVQQQCLLCRSLASSNKSWSTVASVASLFLMETRCCRY